MQGDLFYVDRKAAHLLQKVRPKAQEERVSLPRLLHLHGRVGAAKRKAVLTVNVILALVPSKHHYPTIMDDQVKNDVLVSYWYSRMDDGKFRFLLGLCKRAGRNCVLDSGVYTARKKGVNISIGDYLTYCVRFKNDVQYFFNLDLGPHDQQIQHFKMLVGAGVPTIGIVSNLMSFETIQRFVDIYPYIGISYSVMGQTSGSGDYTQYLERLFEYLYKTNQQHVKTHALGLTKPNVMQRFPFFSVDSSTWINPARYGAVYVFKNGKLATIPAVNKEAGVRKFGVTAMMQREEKSPDIGHRYVYCAREFSKMQDWITNLWNHRGVTWSS